MDYLMPEKPTYVWNVFTLEKNCLWTTLEKQTSDLSVNEEEDVDVQENFAVWVSDFEMNAVGVSDDEMNVEDGNIHNGSKTNWSNQTETK